jgi:hypothetical protein
MKTAGVITTTTVALAAGLAILATQPAAARAAGQAADPDAGARAALASALQAMAQAKLAVSERYTKTHAWAHDATAAGFEAPAGIPGRIAIAEGIITVTFDAPASIAGKTLALVPSDTGDGMVHWRCEAPALPATLKPKGCE